MVLLAGCAWLSNYAEDGDCFIEWSFSEVLNISSQIALVNEQFIWLVRFARADGMLHEWWEQEGDSAEQ